MLIESEIKELANNLGIDVTLFNGDGSSDYIGMTNKQNPNNVYIDINQKEIRGEDMLYHEFLHSRKRNNDSIYIDRIAPIEQDIVQNYTDIIDNFIEEKGLDKRYTNCPELIAEEIIADYTSKHLGEFDIDYNLPQFYIETINQSVDEMLDNIKNGNLLYDIDRGVIKKLTGQGYNYLDASVNENTVARLQLPRNSISNINNSIPFSKENVNNTTINNYSMQNEQKNTQTQQVTPIQDKMAHNGLSTELNTILNNKQLPMQNYQYEKSENIKIDNLRKEASRYFNNSQQTNNFVNMLEKIIADKNVEIRLDSNLMTTDDKVANGLYSNGVITINPNSNRVGEFITIHELTHAIGTKQMASMIENYKNSNLEFESSIQDLLKNYNINEINEEALADISGQLFGNQEFINDMAKNTPNIFQKIYSEIKYLWHQFRGYKNQNQFLEDLYYKWTQAYNSNNKLNNSSYYSIQTDNNGNRYVKVDTDQYIFDGIDKKDYNKIAKMYMQDYLMGKTTLSNNDSAVIDSRSTNKYTNPRQRTSYMNEKMQLTPELKNVLEIAQKDSMSLPTKENSKYKSWEYYKFNFELGGRNFEGTINIGIDKEGNKHFYEINKIRFTGISSVSTNSQHKTDFINNSILPTNKNVNSTTKYSIQESENNSKWKDYLEKNFKPTGSRTNLQDIKLPTKEYFKNRTIKNGQKSTQNIQQEQLNNNVNTQNQQGTPIQNKVAQNGLSEQINNSVANNQETLYNNIESESGINEGIYSRTTGRDGRIENEIANQRRQTNDTRISKDNISKDFKESRQRSYEEFIDYANKNKIHLKIWHIPTSFIPNQTAKTMKTA